MTLKDLDLNHETVNSYEHLSAQIEAKLPFVPPFLLNFIVMNIYQHKLKKNYLLFLHFY